MTKQEFILQVPGIIEHPTGGYGELEIITDTVETKGACYRHKDHTTSYGNYGKTWLEVYDKLSQHLAKK